jgi:hypothetical protein
MRNLKPAFLSLIALTALAWTASDASVAVYPKYLFINAPSRSVAFTVSNPTEIRQEIWVEFRYGYPLVSDSGTFYIEYMETPPPQEPSALPWLSVYPQRFALGPRESQVVRVMAQLPVGVTAGEYWSRVVISSKPRTATQPQNPVANTQMKLEYISQIDIPLQVRTGGVTTGVRIQGVTSAVDSGKLKIGVDVSRFGNASFWGTMHCLLRDKDNRVVRTVDQHIAIFRDVVYPVTIEVADVPPGSYVLELDVDNVRPGVPAQFRLKADAVRFTYQLTIP